MKAAAFEHVNGTDVLRVGPRHRQPVTDELVAQVYHRTTGGGRSALLTRPAAVALWLWLGQWIAEGWDGMPRQCQAPFRDAEGRTWACDLDPDHQPARRHSGKAVSWRTGDNPHRMQWEAA